MFFLNAQLTRSKPGTIYDHGQEIPDYDHMVQSPLGSFNVQPAGGSEDLVRALAEETEWVAYGGFGPELDSADEINILFNSGKYITGLEISAPVDEWESPIGLSHVVIQLKKRSSNRTKGGQQ